MISVDTSPQRAHSVAAGRYAPVPLQRAAVAAQARLAPLSRPVVSALAMQPRGASLFSVCAGVGTTMPRSLGVAARELSQFPVELVREAISMIGRGALQETQEQPFPRGVRELLRHMQDRAHPRWSGVKLELGETLAHIKGGRFEVAGQSLGTSCVVAGAGVQDVNALVQLVLRETYLEGLQSLQMYADKVRFYNNTKKAIREELQRARAHAAAHGKTMPPWVPKSFDASFHMAGTAPPRNVAPDELGPEMERQLSERAEALRQLGPEPKVTKRTERLAGSDVITSRDYGGSEDYGTFDQHGSLTAEDAVAWVQNLKARHPGQEEAIEKALAGFFEMFGLSISVSCKDVDLGNNTYAGMYVYQKNVSESVEEFLSRACARAAGDFKGSVAGQEGAIEITKLEFTVPMPSIALEIEDTLARDQWRQQVGAINDRYPMAAPGGTPFEDGLQWTEGKPIKSKKEMDTYVENLETQLQSVGDDSQLANTDLQSLLQKQQQLIQMMSTIDKVLHDTAMAVIRKMG